MLDIGAGRGALSRPLARTGAEVWAIEADPVWAARLTDGVASDPTVDARLVRIIRADVRAVRLPHRPYRVVANPPFGLTTDVLRLLLDDPTTGPERLDLVVQREVARKHAANPPRHLRTAAWAPWWTFELGWTVPRDAFRPVPAVDAAVLTVTRRSDPVLPERLAPDFADILRPHWDPGRSDAADRRGPSGSAGPRSGGGPRSHRR